MRTHLRRKATGLTIALGLMLGAGACGSSESPQEAAERQVGEAMAEGMAEAGVEGDVDLSEGGLSIDTEDGTMSFGDAELPEGFPSEMPLYDPEATSMGAISLVEDGEQRVGVSFQLEADGDEVLDFYRRELPQSGWDVSEPDVGVPMLSVEGHGYEEGGVTVHSGEGMVTLSFRFIRPAP
jgi:hypothetical protein